MEMMESPHIDPGIVIRSLKTEMMGKQWALASNE